MGRVCVLAAAAMWVVSAALLGPVQAAQGQSASPSAASGTADAHQAMVKRYCVSCHNERLKSGGLVLDGVSLTDLAAGSETWEKVVRKLRTNAMPPANMPRPDAAAKSAFITYLETGIDRAAAAKPFPGRTESIHRLNRAEYRNAVRDLLALDVDVESMLPADDMSYGFDNNGGVLKMTPSLLDRYMATARHVSRLAIGSPTIQPTAETFRLRADLSQDISFDTLPLGTRGGTAIKYQFPLDAEYSIEVEPLTGGTDAAPARGEHRRRAHQGVHRRRPQAAGGGRRGLRRAGRFARGARPGQGRSARRRRHVREKERRARRERARAVLHAARRGRHALAAVSGERHDFGSVRADWRRRDAQPAAHLRVPAEQPAG